jgi:hypothetical protein
MAVKRILLAKYGSCAGQACIAIDYVLVEKSFSSTLVKINSNFFFFKFFIMLLNFTLILKQDFFFSFLGGIIEGMV